MIAGVPFRGIKMRGTSLRQIEAFADQQKLAMRWMGVTGSDGGRHFGILTVDGKIKRCHKYHESSVVSKIPFRFSCKFLFDFFYIYQFFKL